jgi:putative endonuclease
MWWEDHESVVAAIQRETSIKRWKRNWKIDLINRTNPDWKDLYESGGLP